MDALSPTRVPGYAVRTYSGRPRSSIRFSTSAAMATSVACRPSVWKRSASPMTRFHREISASTRARQLYPDALPAQATALGDYLDVPVALRGRSPGCLARHRIRARRHDHGRLGMAGREFGIDIVAVVGAVAGEGCHCPSIRSSRG